MSSLSLARDTQRRFASNVLCVFIDLLTAELRVWFTCINCTPCYWYYSWFILLAQLLTPHKIMAFAALFLWGQYIQWLTLDCPVVMIGLQGLFDERLSGHSINHQL